MLKNQDIICISSIDWDFIWQGHQEIMSVFAGNGNRVLFIENTGVRAPGIKDLSRLHKRFRDYFRGIKGIREEARNLYVYSPIVLPFPYSRVARLINRYILLSVITRWMKVMNFVDPIIWTFLPTGTAMDIIENVDKKLLIYYCIDNFAVSSPDAKKIVSHEKKLLEAADIVFVTSQALYDYCSKYNKKVDLFPFGVNIDNFEKTRIDRTEPPAEFKDIKGPIVGYVGGIHKWIDQELIRSVAAKNPDLNFVFVGPLQTEVSSLSSIGNIRFLGKKKHCELPVYVKYFSAAIIPYLITDYTKNVYPTKLNEYLSMGKPVISTSLPEVEIFNKRYADVVYIAGNKEEFSRMVGNAIKEDNISLQQRRISIAGENSWIRRIELMSEAISKAAEDKNSESRIRWKENLSAFYVKARRKAVKLSVAAAVVCVLLFCTPLVWFLAEPLKISEAPRPSDAIVVFAGGAGESGKQGQGYEERVQYAVWLYKKGYAGHLIFSSGYTYAIREVDIMKALAVSMGVPSEAISLEEKAGYTYEFVRNASEIVEDKGWHSILIVSSPYHMKRVSLVFKKMNNGIEVTYTPIPDGRFYRHRLGASPEQINGILHEYAGIVFYMLKGYI